MLDAWSRPGNPGSPHHAGELISSMVDDARFSVANLIGATTSEIVFTSGATEANNLALLGLAKYAVDRKIDRRKLVISAVEHKAVLEPAHVLSSMGFNVEIVPVDHNGFLDLDALERAVDASTLLVSVMAVNNETGVIQPIARVSETARRYGALVHTDAAQAAGKIPVDVFTLDVDYLSLSAHKLYGPMGIGALFVSATSPKPLPLMFGGGQEGGVRPGTLPGPLIVGFGRAAALAKERLSDDMAHARALSKRMVSQLEQYQLRFNLTTASHDVVPGSLSISAQDVFAEELVIIISKQVQISTGSACLRGQVMPSHVLSAMGYSVKDATSVFRMLCGRYNKIEEIDFAAALIAKTALTLSARTGRIVQ